MTISPIQPIRNDYVTKKEFTEFKSEMRNFRLEFNDFREDMYAFKGEVYTFRDKTDKRFDKIDRQIAELRQDIPRHMSMLQEKFKDQLDMAVELIRDEIRKK